MLRMIRLTGDNSSDLDSCHVLYMYLNSRATVINWTRQLHVHVYLEVYEVDTMRSHFGYHCHISVFTNIQKNRLRAVPEV